MSYLKSIKFPKKISTFVEVISLLCVCEVHLKTTCLPTSSKADVGFLGGTCYF